MLQRPQTQAKGKNHDIPITTEQPKNANLMIGAIETLKSCGESSEQGNKQEVECKAEGLSRLSEEHEKLIDRVT
jgi:hypothetical protein